MDSTEKAESEINGKSANASCGNAVTNDGENVRNAEVGTVAKRPAGSCLSASAGISLSAVG